MLLVLVTGVAATVQGVAGFGFTLLALSFFLLILQSPAAVPLLIIINLAISMLLATRLWRYVDRPLWRRLICGAVLGAPIGLVLFSLAGLFAIKLAAAVAVIGFTAVMMMGLDPATGSGPRIGSAVATGAASGALTTGLGMPGPLLAIYLSWVRTPKNMLRGTSVAFAVVAYTAALGLQVTTLGMPPELWRAALVLAPVAVIGAEVGHATSRFVDERLFRRVVLAILLLTGAYMIVDTLWVS